MVSGKDAGFSSCKGTYRGSKGLQLLPSVKQQSDERNAKWKVIVIKTESVPLEEPPSMDAKLALLGSSLVTCITTTP